MVCLLATCNTKIYVRFTTAISRLDRSNLRSGLWLVPYRRKSSPTLRDWKQTSFRRLQQWNCLLYKQWPSQDLCWYVFPIEINCLHWHIEILPSSENSTESVQTTCWYCPSNLDPIHLNYHLCHCYLYWYIRQLFKPNNPSRLVFAQYILSTVAVPCRQVHQRLKRIPILRHSISQKPVPKFIRLSPFMFPRTPFVFRINLPKFKLVLITVCQTTSTGPLFRTCSQLLGIE